MGAEPYILTLASGKGGVGKSFLAVNIATHLANLGKKVILLDADLGGANLHSLLGINFAQSHPSFYSLDKINDLDQLLIETGLKNLRLLSLAKERANIASLSYIEKLKLTKGIHSLEADFLVIDTPCGTSFNTLDFFLLSPHGIIVATADPLSVENLFTYLKRVIIRKIKTTSEAAEVDELMKEWMSFSATSDKNLIDMFIQSAPPSKTIIIEREVKIALADFKPLLVINQTRTQEEKDLGFGIQKIIGHYFGINIDYLGYIEEHQLVRNSILERKPLVFTYSESKPAKCIQNITNLYLTNYYEENGE